MLPSLRGRHSRPPGRSRRGAVAVVVALVLGACSSGATHRSSTKATTTPTAPKQAATDAGGITTDAAEAKALAKQALVWGYPLVVTQRTWAGLSARAGGINTLWRTTKLAGPADRLVPAPNVDTIYTLAVLDLRKEPMVLVVPAVPGNRFRTVQLVDQYTEVPAYLGSRTEGNDSRTYLLAGPGWKGTVPSGARRVDLATPQAVAVGRILVNGPDDVAAANALASAYRLEPLSQHLGGAPAVPGPPVPFVGRPQEAGNNGVLFLDELAAAMAVNAPRAADRAYAKRFERIGLRSGSVPSTLVTAPAVRRAVDAGLADAYAEITGSSRGGPSLPVVHGWLLARKDLGHYGTDYALRAKVAWCCWGAPEPVDAMYPMAKLDERGARLDGSRRYELTFAAGRLPPVTKPYGFWSITMYDADFFLVPNAIDRYALGDRSGLKRNADGSVTISVQHDDPGTGKNWLPAPASGPFELMMRVYIPGPTILSGEWSPPGIRPVS